MFTLINRLSQQKWNASLSACDFFVLGKTPVVLGYLSCFQPAINFLYLGIVCSMWAAACLVSSEMFHFSLVLVLHFRHTDTEVGGFTPMEYWQPMEPNVKWVWQWFVLTGNKWDDIEGSRSQFWELWEQCPALPLCCPWLKQAQVDAAWEMDLKSTEAVAVLWGSYVFIYMLLIVLSGNTGVSCQLLWYPVALLSFHQWFAGFCQVVSLVLWQR